MQAIVDAAANDANDRASMEALENVLDSLNGQDCYNIVVIARGGLGRAHYLRVPGQLPRIAPAHIGLANTLATIDNLYVLQVVAYALVQFADLPTREREAIALLRGFAVKAGWASLGSTYEIEVQDTVPTQPQYVAAAALIGRCNVQLYMAASILVPLTAEFVFRVLGHHYITGQAALFTEKYAAIFRACLQPEVASLASPEHLYHTALHWCPLFHANVLARSASVVVPTALRIRADAAPAGYAAVSAAAAVVAAMASAGIDLAHEALRTYNLNQLLEANTVVKENSIHLHAIREAYGAAEPTDAVAEIAARGKLLAARFAPVAVGFIRGITSGRDQKRSAALDKLAADNPTVTARVQNFFRKVRNIAPTNLTSAFALELELRPQDIDD